MKLVLELDADDFERAGAEPVVGVLDEIEIQQVDGLLTKTLRPVIVEQVTRPDTLKDLGLADRRPVIRVYCVEEGEAHGRGDHDAGGT